MSRRKKGTQAVAPIKREPTVAEAEAIAAAKQSRKARPARASFAQHPDTRPGMLNLDSPHSDKEGQPYLVAETFGTTSDDFVTNSILDLSNVTVRNGSPSIEGLNATIAIVGAIAPQNELEAALAVQMAATHHLSLDLIRRTKNATNAQAMREYGNLATKMSRTFTAQMKALSDWRRGGEQIVRHVHVYEGGQAVVAETITLGGQNENSVERAHESCAALLGTHPAGHPMPVSGDEREEAVLPPRRRARIRRSTGQS